MDDDKGLDSTTNEGTIFFIVGVQRSGTTLLQTMLGNHPAILMEPRSIAFRMITCFKNLYDLLPYNIQHDRQAFTRWLIQNDEQGRLAALIDYEQIAKYDTIQDLIRSSIQQKIIKQGKQIWGDKSPNLQHYLSDLLLLIPTAKIIHIIRDGRANALSISKRSHKHLALSAQQWVDGNIAGLVHQQILGTSKYQVIQYEQLLKHPEKTLQQVCTFLDLPFSSQMLQLPTESKSYISSFLDTSKIDAWKKQLSKKQIQQIEGIQGHLLKNLAYLLEYPQVTSKNLTLRRRILLNQRDNIRLLFKKKRMSMKEGEWIALNLSFKNRLYSFLTSLVRDLLAFSIFKALFSRYFYKEKYYQDTMKK